MVAGNGMEATEFMHSVQQIEGSKSSMRLNESSGREHGGLGGGHGAETGIWEALGN